MIEVYSKKYRLFYVDPLPKGYKRRRGKIVKSKKRRKKTDGWFWYLPK